MNHNALSQIKISQLRSLVAVAECGNFGEAALSLGISQSAVSHAIASLEEALGVVLFSRGRRGAQLTPVGEQIVLYAQQSLQSLEEMTKAANLARGLAGGTVRIASFRSVATHILPEVIVRFRQQFPAIAISLHEYRDSAELEQALRMGQAEVGFSLTPTGEEFETRELLQDEYVALFPPTFQLTSSALTWEQLSTYPLIGYPEHFRCWQPIEDYFNTLQQRLNVVYRMQEESTIISMVAQGLGCALLPQLAAKPIPPQIQVHKLPVPLVRTISVLTLAQALHPPSVYAFLDVLKQTLEQVEPLPESA